MLLLFICDLNSNQTVQTKQNKVLTSLCKWKQIMVCYMAFSCKTGSISRCLGPAVWALGGFAVLLARLSLQLKIISPLVYLAFIFLSIICSCPALWLPVLMWPLSIIDPEPFGDWRGRWRGGAQGQRGRGQARWCVGLTLQDRIERLHAGRPWKQYTRSHQSVNQPVKDLGDVRLLLSLFLIAICELSPNVRELCFLQQYLFLLWQKPQILAIQQYSMYQCGTSSDSPTFSALQRGCSETLIEVGRCALWQFLLGNNLF